MHCSSCVCFSSTSQAARFKANRYLMITNENKPPLVIRRVTRGKLPRGRHLSCSHPMVLPSFTSQLPHKIPHLTLQSLRSTSTILNPIAGSAEIAISREPSDRANGDSESRSRGRLPRAQFRRGRLLRSAPLPCTPQQALWRLAMGNRASFTHPGPSRGLNFHSRVCVLAHAAGSRGEGLETERN